MSQSRVEKKTADEKPRGSNRKSLTYILSVALLLIIAVTFIGTPALRGAVGGTARTSFGEYAGKPIVRLPGNFFDRRIQDYARYFSSQGAQEDAQTVYQIFQLAYSDTVLHMARLETAQKAGVGVSPEYVDSQLAKWPAFQVDGRFSTDKFNAMQSSELMTLRTYLKELSIAEQVRIDYAAAAAVSDPEIQFLADMARNQRRFRYVEFGSDMYPEDEVIAYGEENPTRFSQINISQITIDSSRADAESIRQQAVDRTSSFEDLARNQSADEFRDEGGERGWVYNWDLEFDFENLDQLAELFSLSDGEISPVYESSGVFRIYRVNERPIEADFSDSATIAEVRTYLTNFERGRIEDYLRATAQEFVDAADSDGFDAAANSINQLPQRTGYFPVNYGNVSYFPQMSSESNSAINSAGAYREEFIRALFALASGEVSEPLVLRDYVFVFELDDVRELDDSEMETLASTLRNQVPSKVYSEGLQAVVDKNLYVDNFVQAYSASVLGQ